MKALGISSYLELRSVSKHEMSSPTQQFPYSQRIRLLVATFSFVNVNDYIFRVECAVKGGQPLNSPIAV